jgi:hypothetical protein
MPPGRQSAALLRLLELVIKHGQHVRNRQPHNMATKHNIKFGAVRVPDRKVVRICWQSVMTQKEQDQWDFISRITNSGTFLDAPGLLLGALILPSHKELGRRWANGEIKRSSENA